MKVEVKSMWDDNKRRPNVWFNIAPENEAEKALLHSLYPVSGKVIMSAGQFMIDFYPQGVNKKGKK